ncbi:MAG: hypothetical protein LBI53_03350 [Candidatus Peribacteria bacterium]|jgi:hypothetical protein|nr:hypothetical protein [Candidatus Peribacteria bacterium]
MSLKKGILRGILAVATVALSACETKKDYEMSFANATALLQKQTQTFSDILLQPAGSQEQTISISTFLKDLEGTDIGLDLAVISQKNIENNESDATITFDANFQAEEMDIAASGTLKMLTNLQHLYLNAEKF